MELVSALTSNISLQNGKYVIEKILGQGGFGITYLANFPLMNKKVAIKELFISGYCVRNTENISVTLQNMQLTDFKHFKERFMQEAMMLHNLRNPYLVWVQDMFEENETVYFVMDYVEGISLKTLINEKTKLNEDEAVNYKNNLDTYYKLNDASINGALKGQVNAHVSLLGSLWLLIADAHKGTYEAEIERYLSGTSDLLNNPSKLALEPAMRVILNQSDLPSLQDLCSCCN